MATDASHLPKQKSQSPQQLPGPDLSGLPCLPYPFRLLGSLGCQLSGQSTSRPRAGRGCLPPMRRPAQLFPHICDGHRPLLSSTVTCPLHQPAALWRASQRETGNLGAGVGCAGSGSISLRAPSTTSVLGRTGCPKGDSGSRMPPQLGPRRACVESRVPTTFRRGSMGASWGLSEPECGHPASVWFCLPEPAGITPITAQPSTGPVTRGHGPCPPHPGPCLAHNSIMVFAG